MTELLVADVGGTGSRLAVMVDGKQQSAAVDYGNHDFNDFDSIVSDFLSRTACRPQQFAVAVAGPVHDGVVQMTNLPWSISAPELAGQFGFARVDLLNDFEALAWSTRGLTANDLVAIGGGVAQPNANRVVLGPGTGLGVAALVYGDGSWVPVAGEGGHVSLAASSTEEAQLIAATASDLGHCSAERLLSGAGITRIAEGLGYGSLAPEAVTAGLLVKDYQAEHIMKVFSELLGTVAANLALSFGAFGGVYIAGGILPRVGSWFIESGFRARFERKGRFSDYLASIPTSLITAAHPTFLGLDVQARQ
jgi:glucokinase